MRLYGAKTLQDTQSKIDFVLENFGSIFLLRHRTEAGLIWIYAHVSRAGFQPYYPDNIIIEPRYVPDIIAGIRADGLVVRV